MNWMLEIIDECKSERDAVESLEGLSTQDGFVCGRILSKGGGKPWRAQAFFPDLDDPSMADHLPDGVHRRLVPESVIQSCRVR